MAKEINLFEMEIESPQIEVEDVKLPIIDVPRGTYSQTTFPGILEKIQVDQERLKSLEKSCKHVKKIIEALLFASNEPLPFNKIREVIDTVEPLKPSLLKEIISELANEYVFQQRSFRLEEIAQGYVLRSCKEYSPYIDLLHRNKRTEKLSQASAEVLAIIAYRQPITRPQIDAIRGVDSSGTLQNLLERQLIEIIGKLEAPGRPSLYSITKDFLKHFGLRDIDELPKLSGKEGGIKAPQNCFLLGSSFSKKSASCKHSDDSTYNNAGCGERETVHR